MNKIYTVKSSVLKRFELLKAFYKFPIITEMNFFHTETDRQTQTNVSLLVLNSRLLQTGFRRGGGGGGNSSYTTEDTTCLSARFWKRNIQQESKLSSVIK